MQDAVERAATLVFPAAYRRRVRRFGGRIDLVLIVLCSLPTLFLGLGDLPVLLWDESRLANNAVEMSATGWSLVTTYQGSPDLWNTKPPLLIWLIAGAFHLFGPSAWSLRLPSALAALATAMIVYRFCRDVAADRVAGLAGALVLLTSYGFVGPHVARSGDYDALLVLFVTALFAGCYRIMQTVREGRRPGALLVAGTSLALTGAVMTKGVAAMLILPGIVIAAIDSGTMVPALRDRRIQAAIALPLLVAGAFYLAREAVGPGYLDAVWRNEVGGRFATPLEGHGGSILFYVADLLLPPGADPRNLYLASAFPWSWLVVPLLLIRLRPAPAPVPGPLFASRYIVIVLATFLAIISVARTKLAWYVAPAFPLIACLTAIRGHAILRPATGPAGVSRPSPTVIAGAVFVAALMVGAGIVDRHRADIVRHPDLAFVTTLQRLARDLPPGSTLHIAPPVSGDTAVRAAPYRPQEQFYAAMMRQRGIDARLIAPGDQTTGDRARGCDDMLAATERLPARPVITADPACPAASVANGSR